MLNRNRAYLQPKIFFMNCLCTYIAQSRIFRGKEANKIPCSQSKYLGFYTSQNIYIFRCIMSEYYFSQVLFEIDVCVIINYFIGRFQKIYKIKNQISPGRAQKSIKSKNWPVETIFLPKTRFLPKTIFF